MDITLSIEIIYSVITTISAAMKIMHRRLRYFYVANVWNDDNRILWKCKILIFKGDSIIFMCVNDCDKQR